MKTLLLSLLFPLTLTLGFASAAPLDLTPRPAMAAGDGMEQAVVTFQRGKGCVALLQMAKWTAAGSATSVTFNKQDASQASLQVSLVAKPLALEDKTAEETVKQMLLASVPREAVEVNVVSAGRNQLSINGWQSVDAEVTFNFFGNLMHRTLSLWSQAPDTQLQVVVNSFDRDYEKVGKSAFRFLRTWSEVPPEQMATFRFNARTE